MRVEIKYADIAGTCPAGLAMQRRFDGAVFESWTQYNTLWVYLTSPECATWLRCKRRIPPPCFAGMNLSGMQLVGCDLRGVSFQGADLRGTNFAGSSLRRACLVDAALDGATWEGADLAGALSSQAVPGWRLEKGKLAHEEIV